MTEFRFAHPAAFLLLLLPLAAFALSRRWSPESPLIRYSDVRLMGGLPVSWRVRLRRLPDWLRLLAWVLLVVALARPQGGRAQEVIRGQGVDIVLTLDISGSMAAPDFDPQNRLEAAKTVISSFIAGREFDRIGLVVFAADAFQHVPPTLDYDVLLRALGEVQLATDLGLEDKTAIGMGLASAANMLRASSAASKIIILLTDGANNAGALDPLTAAQAVATLGMRVYTIGMATADTRGELDEDTLQAIAATANGRYFRAQDLQSLQAVYDQIDMLERSDVQRQVLVRWQEQATGWLVAALVLLIVERALRHTVFQSIP